MTPPLPTVKANPCPNATRRHRQRLNYKDKAQVLLWMQQHSASFTDTCSRFGLAESTLRKWSMRKTSILDAASTMKGCNKSIHKSTVPSLESMVMGWIQERSATKPDEGLSRATIKIWLNQAKDHLMANINEPIDAEQRSLQNLKITPHFIHKFMARHHLLDHAGRDVDDVAANHITYLANLTETDPLPASQILAVSNWDQRIVQIEQAWGVTKPDGNRSQRIKHLERIVFGKTYESKTMAERLAALE